MILPEDLPHLFQEFEWVFRRLEHIARYKRVHTAEEAVIRLDCYSMMHRVISTSRHPWSRSQFPVLYAAVWMTVNALHNCDAVYLYYLEYFGRGSSSLCKRDRAVIATIHPSSVMRTQLHLIKVVGWNLYSHCITWGLK